MAPCRFWLTFALLLCLFFCYLRSIHVRAPTPLAWKIERAFSVEEIAKVLEIGNTVGKHQNADFRNFGYGGAGHNVIYLNHVMDAQLRRHMLELARTAESSAGWKSSSAFNLTARCMELISYPGRNQTTSTGWHHDGATFLTIAVMLTERDQYEGGSVNFQRADVFESYNLHKGDALVWHGWNSHHVSPVTSGLRQVFVIEFWSGYESEGKGLFRVGDSVEDIRAALRLDNASDRLYEKLGDTLCDDWPCAFAEEAEDAFHKYLLFSDILALRVLGPILSIIPSRWPICVFAKLQAFKILKSKSMRRFLVPYLHIVVMLLLMPQAL